MATQLCSNTDQPDHNLFCSNKRKLKSMRVHTLDNCSPKITQSHENEFLRTSETHEKKCIYVRTNVSKLRAHPLKSSVKNKN